MEFAKKIGALTGALVLFLLAGELAVRAFLKHHTLYDLEMTRYSLLLKEDSPNPKIGHGHTPRRSARLMNVEVRINADGFRDEEYSPGRSGRRRLIFLGDSLTLGWGVAKEETFEHLLESKLSQIEPTEILNFGTGNYNTEQEVELLLEKGLNYQPDEVVIFYFINDAEITPQTSRWGFLGHSRIITLYWSRLQAVLNRLLPGRNFEAYYHALYEEGAPGWQKEKEAFGKARSVCQANGVGLSVVLLPELHRLEDYPFKEEHRKVSDFLRSQGIRVLDLAPFFKDQQNPEKLWVAPDDAHPNPFAHRLIAESTFDFLAEALPKEIVTP